MVHSLSLCGSQKLQTVHSNIIYSESVGNESNLIEQVDRRKTNRPSNLYRKIWKNHVALQLKPCNKLKGVLVTLYEHKIYFSIQS